MKNEKLEPVSDAELLALKRGDDFGWEVKFNNAPAPDSGIAPGTQTMIFKIGDRRLSITEDQFNDLVWRRLGFADQQNAFLARHFPDKFGTAKA